MDKVELKVVEGPYKGRKVTLSRPRIGGSFFGQGRKGDILLVEGLEENWWGKKSIMQIPVGEVCLEYIPFQKARDKDDVATGMFLGTLLLGPVGLLTGAALASQRIEADYILLTYPTEGPEVEGKLYLGGPSPRKLGKIYRQLVEMLS